MTHYLGRNELLNTKDNEYNSVYVSSRLVNASARPD